jgi:hypothetical protein
MCAALKSNLPFGPTSAARFLNSLFDEKSIARSKQTEKNKTTNRRCIVRVFDDAEAIRIGTNGAHTDRFGRVFALNALHQQIGTWAK